MHHNGQEEDLGKTSLLESSASFWCRRITEGERLALYSSRDGKYLKRIDEQKQLDVHESMALLVAEYKEHPLLQTLVADGARYQKGCSAYRSLLYLLRSRIYLRAYQQEQAEKDAKCSLAYSEGQALQAYFSCLTLAEIFDQSGEALEAALQLAEALNYSAEVKEDIGNWLDRLFDALPSTARAAYLSGGALGLQQWADFQRELQKPPILQKLPKYYWYYQWMTKRIEYKCGRLPPPVMDKLLCMDASELDTLLMSSTAIQAQANELLWILENKGSDYLETYKTPELTWEETKYIQEIKDVEEEPKNLLKDSENKTEIQEIPLLLETPVEFLTRKEKLLTHKHHGLNLEYK